MWCVRVGSESEGVLWEGSESEGVCVRLKVGGLYSTMMVSALVVTCGADGDVYEPHAVRRVLCVRPVSSIVVLYCQPMESASCRVSAYSGVRVGRAVSSGTLRQRRPVGLVVR